MPWPGDICFSMWEQCYASGLMVFPQHGRVLEIGGAESDWVGPLKEERPDLSVITIDWRNEARPAADQSIRGDVLTMPFADGTFDAIVGISSIEHIGLGHYNHDPLDVDGDLHCAQLVGRWLKPGGWFYADVPWAEQFRVEGTSHRCYADIDVQRRLAPSPLVIQHLWHYPDHIGYVAMLARKPA